MNDASGSNARRKGWFSNATGVRGARAWGGLSSASTSGPTSAASASRSSATRPAGSQPPRITRWSLMPESWRARASATRSSSTSRSAAPVRAPAAHPRPPRPSRRGERGQLRFHRRKPDLDARLLLPELRPELVEGNALELLRQRHLLEIAAAEQGSDGLRDAGGEEEEGGRAFRSHLRCEDLAAPARQLLQLAA